MNVAKALSVVAGLVLAGAGVVIALPTASGAEQRASTGIGPIGGHDWSHFADAAPACCYSGGGARAQEFRGKLSVCRQRPSCSGFASWGLTDRGGSTADIPGYRATPGNALPGDDKIAPKKIYQAMMDELSAR